MNAMERPLTCGCTTSKCDGCTCGSVVSTTAHGHGVADRHTMKPDSGDCIEMQVVLKTHHPNKSRELGHDCPISGQHPDNNQSIANNCQYGDEIAQEASVEGISPNRLWNKFYEIIETWKVLVNDGSSIGSHTLDRMEPPKLASEITQLPPLNQKMFLRDLRTGKAKQICVLVAEDEYISDIRSAMVFAENERVLSSSLMDESVLDEKTYIERYTSRLWESLKRDPLYNDLTEFRDVHPETVPCELPKDNGTRHEIDLKPGSKYYIKKQWPLPREQVLAIDKFFADRLAAGHVREPTSPHISPTFCVRKFTG